MLWAISARETRHPCFGAISSGDGPDRILNSTDRGDGLHWATMTKMGVLFNLSFKTEQGQVRTAA